MPWILSEPIADAVTAVERLRTDDRVITDRAQRLDEIKAVVEAINALNVVLARKLRGIHVQS